LEESKEGIRRLFSRGGQNFSRGARGIKNLPYKPPKSTFFLKKVKKNILFCPAKGGGGKSLLLYSPADAHVIGPLPIFESNVT